MNKDEEKPGKPVANQDGWDNIPRPIIFKEEPPTNLLAIPADVKVHDVVHPCFIAPENIDDMQATYGAVFLKHENGENVRKGSLTLMGIHKDTAASLAEVNKQAALALQREPERLEAELRQKQRNGDALVHVVKNKDT